MGVGACAGYVRAGLVAVLLLLLPASGYSQNDQRGTTEQSSVDSASPGLHDLPLKDLGEIKKSNCTRHYRNPLNLLFLLPGMLFFLFSLVTRKAKNILPFFFFLLLTASSEPDPYISIREAQRSFQAGHYSEAIELYRQAEQVLPCNPALLYNLGILSHYLGEQGQAIHYLRQSLREKPGDPRCSLSGPSGPCLPVAPSICECIVDHGRLCCTYKAGPVPYFFCASDDSGSRFVHLFCRTAPLGVSIGGRGDLRRKRSEKGSRRRFEILV